MPLGDARSHGQVVRSEAGAADDVERGVDEIRVLVRVDHDDRAKQLEALRDLGHGDEQPGLHHRDGGLGVADEVRQRPSPELRVHGHFHSPERREAQPCVIGLEGGF